MRLIASMVVRNELGRYLELAVEHALTYCDRVAILDDGSTDGFISASMPGALGSERVSISTARDDDDRLTFRHEGRTRQRLLEFTMMQDPTHILVIDADEFVADPEGLRAGLQRGSTIGYRLCMEEVWRADADGLDIRCDGGWHPHSVPIAFQAPRELYGDWRIQDRALACGREPVAIRKLQSQGESTELDVEILHFGWTNVAERDERYQRYAVADGGKFHRNAHIQSIRFPDDRIDFERIEWPAGLDSVADRLLERLLRD